MQSLIDRQNEIISKISKLQINFNKDSVSRKTPEYLKGKIELLDSIWDEFQQNHEALYMYRDEAREYFTEDTYGTCKELYEELRHRISSYGKISEKVERAVQPCGELDDILSLQRTHFRAFTRLINNIDVNIISEKWEIEDELRSVQARWNTIDNLHLKIDNILAGGDITYEQEFSKHELSYKNIKRELNKKLLSTAHIQHSVPQLEIPIFTGKYTQWPTFFDLFSEAIHNNNSISKAQKMQHLKGKVRGEAERLIQHLHISAENYDTAWEILLHRYNNPQVLFSNQIELFLNQHNITKQTSTELKRLYDTTTECIHAIHNLGVDTTTWDPLLVHLLCKKLDSDTYSDYKESRKSPRDLPTLDELMTFLESKFTALEPIYRKEKEFVPLSSNIKRIPYQSKINNRPYHKDHKSYQTVATTYINKCPLCNLQHELFKCRKFLCMSPEMQLRSIAKHYICQNCLYKHYEKQCTSTKRCKVCNRDHNTLLHDAYIKSSHSISHTTSAPRLQPSTSTMPAISEPTRQINVNHVATDDEEILLTTVLLNVLSFEGEYITLRALLDQGSQVSLITENAAQLLGLQRQRCNASVSGIGPVTKQSKGMVLMDCQSIYGDYQFKTQALVISRVINNLPNTSIRKYSWPHIQNLKLGDPEYYVSRPIDILLDASVYSDIIMNGLIKGSIQAPIAQQTKLGWILSGNVKTFNCHVLINNIDISKYWEIEDISDPASSSHLKESDQYCEEFYQRTTRRTSSGRYEVGIPMIPGYQTQLGQSKSKAIAQFKQLENKMSKNKEYSDSYKKFINEYCELNHMRLISNSHEHSNYLPHHGVIKLDSNTTRLRVVFNASAKTSSGQSLNNLMYSGPNIQKDLQELILTWRTYKYVITADIEKMFRQILVRECDQHLQTIIWRDSPHELLQEYQLLTITYGTKAAPYLAIRTLRQLAQDEANNFPLAASALENSCFMDDFLGGQNTIEEAKQMQSELIQVLSGAGMNLRKWSSNEPELLRDLSPRQLNAPLEFKCSESRKMLGLRWNPSSDSFTFKNQLTQENPVERPTKRRLLSEISKIFDPLGWLSPLSVRAKLLFQSTWTANIGWDDEIPTELHKVWIRILEDFNSIEDIIIPRHLGDTQNFYQLHAFCDASDKAYACAIYLVTNNNKGVYTSTLIAGKTRVSPINKTVSLPRLELCGALLLSQLLQKILHSIPTNNINVYAWTDSMIVLGWLHGDVTRWKQFVSNRVQQIIKVTPPSCWHHVRSEDNPADCATRGLHKNQLLQDHKLWWEGPEWLRNFNANNLKKISYQTPSIEIKASVNTALQYNNKSLVSDLLFQYSWLTRIVKVIGWILRFINCLRNKHTATNCNSLTSTELSNAYNLIIKEVQLRHFEHDIYTINKNGFVHSNSKIISLNPFIDDQGILRVGGRLRNSNISESAKHPIILSNHCRFTDLLISQAHITTLHGGPKLTLSFIRNKFWIISGIRTVKRQLRQCVKCRRFNHDNQQHLMGDLPQSRVTPSRPFTHTGVDFTGHIMLKANKGRGIKTTKGYVSVFVCLSTKAIHLELVSDLSTPTFLAAFRRFCARRGTPCHMYSDNGTNFVGANRLMKREYQEIIQNINTDFINNISDLDIEWHFNAPAWPNAGGLWEAAVKSLKYHLKRILGEQRLTYEEFTTLLHQIEACLNSRPLCQLTENPEDYYLTPGHFLVGGSLLSRPQTEPHSFTLSKKWQLVQHMNKHFWKRWSTEYLQQLQSRSKWRTPISNLKINDIVLIKEDNLPPGKWALGKITELHPGKDGFIRVVSLKTNNNIIKRPTSKLVQLPVHEEKTSICEQEPIQQNQSFHQKAI